MLKVGNKYESSSHGVFEVLGFTEDGTKVKFDSGITLTLKGKTDTGFKLVLERPKEKPTERIDLRQKQEFSIKHVGKIEINKTGWIKYIFRTRSWEDWRPLEFCENYPYSLMWRSKEKELDRYCVIEMWLPVGEKLEKYYDDAYMISQSFHKKIEMKNLPDWYKSK